MGYEKKNTSQNNEKYHISSVGCKWVGGGYAVMFLRVIFIKIIVLFLGLFLLLYNNK
jgi:hypothetical protein